MNTLGALPLPTDNLYKFYALTGVAIVLLTFYTVNRLSDDLSQRVNAASLAVEKGEIESNFLEHRTNRIKEIADDAKAQLSGEVARKDGKPTLHISEQEAAKMLVQTEELNRDFGLKLAEIHAAMREIAQAKGYLKFIRIVGTLCATAGAWLALYGFKKWRVIQKMQDKALERQFAELKSESPVKPGPPS